MASFGQNNDWFIIEGTIGAGKSTMCKMLGEALKEVAEVIQEPVDKWRTTVDDESGKNILQNFYEDQQRWSYSFQTYTFLTRMEDMMTKPQQKPIRLVERSIYTDKLVFAKSLADMGKMSRLEWNMYNDWWSWLSKECFDKISHPRGFIYLRTEPKTAFDRMLKRERSEEKCVPLDYLKINVQYHDDWLLSDEFKEKVLVIDVNDEFETDPVEFERIKGLIMEFVESRKSKTQKSTISSVPSIPSVIIGDELCDFFEIPHNPPSHLPMMNKEDAILRVVKYTWDNHLTDGADDGFFNLDEKLRKLLAIEDENQTQCSYKDIGAQMKRHFIDLAKEPLPPPNPTLMVSPWIPDENTA